MAIQHSNPTQPRYDSKTHHEQWAHAPYNFIPLNETIVKAEEPLPQDVFEGLSGVIECEIETRSPTYIRGMLTKEVWQKYRAQEGEKLTAAQKEKAAPFFSVEKQPLLPGSSLRGMVRQLVEIAGYGRIRWVGDRPTFTYRAVAASRDDPLRAPYEEMIGRFGSNVQAGYLERQGENWLVRPAKRPKTIESAEKGSYFKVKEKSIGSRDIPNLLRFDDPNYKPGAFRVSFDVEAGRGARGAYAKITRIGPRENNYKHKGFLVASGNMLETETRGNAKSPRRNHALVLEADNGAKLIEIPKYLVDAYEKGLTDFQKTDIAEAWEGKPGVLKEGQPVFYVANRGQVRAFGHSPNFRVPAFQGNSEGVERPVQPPDMVPEAHRKRAFPDLADAMFGWVEGFTDASTEDQEKWRGQRAGRVFFGDARFVGSSGDVWYSDKPITPHILGQPRPTTFQHYLVQDDPDDKKSLAHYGTPLGKTQIRGFKQYWHRGESPDIEATADEVELKPGTTERKRESQLTSINPLRSGVCFRSKIHFENLRREELGALLWALTLPGAEGTDYLHKLGMGKPLGMGAMKITTSLRLSDRRARYTTLFEGQQWAEPQLEEAPTPHELIADFEQHVLRAIGSSNGRLREEERIQMLLTMLEWRAGDDAWQQLTSYMEIEKGSQKINEYKERPVLPDPLGVVAEYQGEAQARPRRTTEHRGKPARGSAKPAESATSASQEPSTPPSKPAGPMVPAENEPFKGQIFDHRDGFVLLEIPGFSRDKLFGAIPDKDVPSFQLNDIRWVAVTGETTATDGRRVLLLRLVSKSERRERGLK